MPRCINARQRAAAPAVVRRQRFLPGPGLRPQPPAGHPARRRRDGSVRGTRLAGRGGVPHAPGPRASSSSRHSTIATTSRRLREADASGAVAARGARPAPVRHAREPTLSGRVRAGGHGGRRIDPRGRTRARGAGRVSPGRRHPPRAPRPGQRVLLLQRSGLCDRGACSSAARPRVLYVDLDAHHGDGVQDAFDGDPRVLLVSIHEAGRWPHTGVADDRGSGNACNLPVPAGFNDRELRLLMDEVVLPSGAAFDPDAVVVTCGTDALAGRPAVADGAQQRRALGRRRRGHGPRRARGRAGRRRLQPLDTGALLDRALGPAVRPGNSRWRCRRRRS